VSQIGRVGARPALSVVLHFVLADSYIYVFLS